jgi:DinB superfamily
MTQPDSVEASPSRMLHAFGETPEQMRLQLSRAFELFEAAISDAQPHWLTAPAEGRWSPAQVSEHVALVSEGVAKIVGLLLSDKPLRSVPAEPGETVDGKRLAPVNLQPGPGSDWTGLQPRWQASHASLAAAAERLEHADPSRRFYHPFMGELDACDWLRMATYHIRHHRRQLAE